MRDDRVGHYTVRIADRYKHWTTATYAFSTRHERGVRFNVAYHTHCVSKIEMRYDSGQSQQATIVSSDRIDSMSQHEKVLAHACSPMKRCRSDNTISIFCGELFVSSIRAVRILLPCIAFSFIVVGQQYTTWWPTPGVLIQPCPTSRDRNGVPFQYDNRDHGSCRHKQRSTHLFLVPLMITTVYLAAKTVRSVGTQPPQRTTSATILFFVAAHETDSIRTCCSGNIVPTG